MSKDDQDDLSPEERKTPGRFTGPGLVVPLLIVTIIAGWLYVAASSPREISYTVFRDQLKAKNVAELRISSKSAIGKFKQPIAAAAQTEKPADVNKEPGNEPQAE